eukprot:2473502-Rhodomonas_salina.3
MTIECSLMTQPTCQCACMTVEARCQHVLASDAQLHCDSEIKHKKPPIPHNLYHECCGRFVPLMAGCVLQTQIPAANCNPGILCTESA